MKEKSLHILDSVVNWLIIILPFSVAISPAFINIVMGMLIGFFVIKKIIKRGRFFTRTAIDLPLLLFFIISCLSVLKAVNLKDALSGGIFKLLRYIFIFFIMAEEVKDSRGIKMIFWSILLGVCLINLDSLWQRFTGKDFIRGYQLILNFDILRTTASFKDANVLGVYLSSFTPLIFGSTLYYYKNKGKALMVLISLLSAIGIILTFSRPTLLAVYISILILAILKKDKIMISLLALIILLTPFLLPKSIKEWSKLMGYNPVRILCNDDRIAIYRNTFNMIRQNPVLGVGTNNFMKSYKKYKENPEYRNVVTSDYVYAHNNFFHIAGELGLIGLAIFLWLLYKLFQECKNIYQRLKNNYLKMFLACTTVCLVSFLINGLTESSLFYARVGLIFWYLMGLALGINKFSHESASR